MSLLYTLRPNEDYAEIADSNDATFYESQFNLPTTRRLSAEGLVADTHVDDNALIQHVIVYARARITTPPLQTRYTDAEVTLGFESGESVAINVAMWDQNAFSTRDSGIVTQSPRGSDWTLSELLELYIGAAVTVQGGVSPSPKWAIADVWVEVYGIPSSELVQRKFESGIYSLVIGEDAPLVAPLTPAETRAVYIAAIRSHVDLSLTAIVLDNGTLTGEPNYEVNSTYAAMLTAIEEAGGGSVNPEEL